MARSCTGSGYRFEFSGKRNWRSSKDDNWNTEVGKNMCGRVVGRRRIDGAECSVIKVGRKFYAVTSQSVKKSR
jgi:hypothetical protein